MVRKAYELVIGPPLAESFMCLRWRTEEPQLLNGVARWIDLV
jgi:hypothetical protein